MNSNFLIVVFYPITQLKNVCIIFIYTITWIYLESGVTLVLVVQLSVLELLHLTGQLRLLLHA